MNLKEIRHENHMNEVNEGSGYFIVLQFEARLLLENKTYHKNVISLQIIKRIGGITSSIASLIPAGNYMFKVNNRNTGISCENVQS